LINAAQYVFEEHLTATLIIDTNEIICEHVLAWLDRDKAMSTTSRFLQATSQPGHFDGSNLAEEPPVQMGEFFNF